MTGWPESKKKPVGKKSEGVPNDWDKQKVVTGAGFKGCGPEPPGLQLIGASRRRVPARGDHSSGARTSPQGLRTPVLAGNVAAAVGLRAEAVRRVAWPCFSWLLIVSTSSQPSLIVASTSQRLRVLVTHASANPLRSWWDWTRIFHHSATSEL